MIDKDFRSESKKYKTNNRQHAFLKGAYYGYKYAFDSLENKDSEAVKEFKKVMSESIKFGLFVIAHSMPESYNHQEANKFLEAFKKWNSYK